MGTTLPWLTRAIVLWASVVQPAFAECNFDIYFVPTAGLASSVAENPFPDVPEEQAIAGTIFPDASKAPYDAFRRLDTVVNDIERWCTGVVAGRDNILLTAAHCIRDNVNGAWVEDFTLFDLADTPSVQAKKPKCMVTPRGWVGRIPHGFAGRFFWPDDYAFVVFEEALGGSALEIKAVPSPAPVRATGLPFVLGKHRKLVEVAGEAVSDTSFPSMGTVAFAQPGMSLGVSGGAWLSTANEVVGISSFANATVTGFLVGGSYFDACIALALAFAEQECG